MILLDNSPPSFPVTGKDLLNMGFKEGKEVGEKLNEIRDWWINKECKPSHKECLSKAEKVTAEAEEQAAKNEEILQAARKEAQNIVAQAREAGDKLKHKMETDGKEQYDGMVEKAKEQIDMEKQKALSEIKTTVVDIALKASEKVVFSFAIRNKF